MKKIIALLLLITGLTQGFSQTAKKINTGDDELDKSIESITMYARSNRETFKAALVSKFSLTEAQAKDYVSKYQGGDLFMIFETIKQTGKSTDAVFEVFNKHRATKGWTEILKELGVKPAGKNFEAIKTAVVNNGIA
ncbi:MAG: hypothetical protein K0S33_2059 [Bacteroidetes bacterium]|jgi:hypothetical protein|nr:hypothetical protein [Bacteroidota bacterium]